MSDLVTPEAVQTSSEWPLTRPFMSYDAGMAPLPTDLPVRILLADDAGWEWLQAHPGEAVEVAHHLLNAAVESIDPRLWRIGKFRVADAGRIRLVTRGIAVGGRMEAAVLDVDQEG